MNIASLLYQAERTHSAAEQREIDAQAGEFAAAIAQGRPRWAARGDPAPGDAAPGDVAPGNAAGGPARGTGDRLMRNPAPQVSRRAGDHLAGSPARPFVV